MFLTYYSIYGISLIVYVDALLCYIEFVYIWHV